MSDGGSKSSDGKGSAGTASAPAGGAGGVPAGAAVRSFEPGEVLPWVEGAGGLARLVCLVGGPLLLAGGVLGLYAALAAGLGAQAGLEAVLVLCGVIALLIGLRVVRGGIGLSLACVGGTVLVASLLTEPSVRFALTGGGTVADRAGVPMVPLFIGRSLLGVLFGVAAAVVVIERRPGRSVGLLLKAAAAMAPCVLIAAVWVVPGLRSAVTGVHSIVTAFAATVSLIAACGLFAMAVQWTIDAFAAGKLAGKAAGARSA